MKLYAAFSVIGLSFGLPACVSAALFSGNAAFTTPAYTQMGTISSNTLFINNGPYGFTVSGVVQVQVGAGAVSGTLLSWDVDRALDPGFGTGPMITTTVITGFSSPPSGTMGNSNGFTSSYFNLYPGVSNSTIPLTLTNGVASWNAILVQSGIFTYTSSFGNNYLKQHFELDGVKLSGPAGIWYVDLPVETYVITVPEPVSMVGMLLGVPALLIRRLRNTGQIRA